MSFPFLSATAVLAGIAAIAVALWFAQRLRVQHREVEVLSTIFWQQALEETRAHVFVRRFRHWWAWALLVTIASLLWILLAAPQAHSLDGTRHVVLINRGLDDQQLRQDDWRLAMEVAGSLPVGDREIIAVGTELETLLRPGEPLTLARLRGEFDSSPRPSDLTWAIETLAARATTDSPLAIHVIGGAPVDPTRLATLLAMSRDDDQGKPFLTVDQVERDAADLALNPVLATLGVADSVQGSWDLVDLWIAIAGSDPSAVENRIAATVEGSPIRQTATLRGDGLLELRGVPANGATIDIAYQDRTVGSITVPNRTKIRVQIDADVPDTIRQLIQLDPACEIIDADADVTIGSSADANFRLVSDDETAIAITADAEDPEEALADLVDRLAIEQIDATGIAETSGRVVDVQVTSGDKRTIAIWKDLFTSSFDFQESRACPVFVARSMRWLADRPPLVPWAELGQRLPESSPEFGRVIDQRTQTDDGRTLRAARLAADDRIAASLPRLPFGSLLAGISPITWLGLVVSLLLVGEWVLHQRGHIP